MRRVHEKLASGRLIACTNAIIPTRSKNKKESGSDVDKGSYYTCTLLCSNSGCKTIVEWLFVPFSMQRSGYFSSHALALCFPSQWQRQVTNLTCQIPRSPGHPTAMTTPHRDLHVSASSALHYFKVSLHSQSTVKWLKHTGESGPKCIPRLH